MNACMCMYVCVWGWRGDNMEISCLDLFRKRAKPSHISSFSSHSHTRWGPKAKARWKEFFLYIIHWSPVNSIFHFQKHSKAQADLLKQSQVFFLEKEWKEEKKVFLFLLPLLGKSIRRMDTHCVCVFAVTLKKVWLFFVTSQPNQHTL